MRILIAAGGTGGHLYPALATASYLKEHHLVNRILWVVGKRDLESELISSQGFEFKQLKTQAFPRTLSIKWISFGISLVVSFFQSFLILLRFKPSIVIGMGSFHSYPVVTLAFLFGIRSLICEQNVYPSLTNRLLSHYASKIATTWAQTNEYLPPKATRAKNKIQLMGNPVRSEILKTKRKEGIEKLNLDKNKFTFLFLGGSQGAHSLNKAGAEAIKLLDKEKLAREIQVIFITGRNDIKWVKDCLKSLKIKILVFPYLKEIQYAYTASDLVICRSGAGTIAEITALGLPSILIPYPYAAEGHQYKNAKVLEEKGASYIIIEKDLTGERLKKLLLDLIDDRPLLEKMARQSKKLGRPQAARKIAELIVAM